MSSGACLFLKFLSDSDEQPGGNHHPVHPTDSRVSVHYSQ